MNWKLEPSWKFVQNEDLLFTNSRDISSNTALVGLDDLCVNFSNTKRGYA